MPEETSAPAPSAPVVSQKPAEPEITSLRQRLAQQSTPSVANHHNSIFAYTSPLDAGLRSIELGLIAVALLYGGLGTTLTGGFLAFGVAFTAAYLKDNCDKPEMNIHRRMN